MGAASDESTQPLAGQGQHSYGTSGSSSPYQMYQGYPVIQAEPPPVLHRNHYEDSSEWTTNLCGCLMDIPNCVFTMFCPCLAFGRVAENLDDGNTSCITAALVWYVIQQLTLCGCIYSYAYRRKLRHKYNLPSRPLPDCLVHLCCWFCAICQETREIKNREVVNRYYAGGTMLPPPYQSFPPRR